MKFYNTDVLKTYQKNALNSIIEDFFKEIENKKERRVVVAPTGSGKTFMMFALIEYLINEDKKDIYRFILITHSLQMAKSFKEDIKKLNTSIYTFEDLENGISRTNDKVILLNPEKVNKDKSKGIEFLSKWKKNNKDKKVILLMDEADITHDGSRNQKILEIMKPEYELGFTATFDLKKDIKKSKTSNREPSKIIHTVSISDVKKEQVIIKGFESISDTQGVTINSIIRAALEKQCEIYDKTKNDEDSYVPRVLIQTNAIKVTEIKDIVLKEISKIGSLYLENKYKNVGILTAEIKEFEEENKENYLIIIGDGIIARGWDYPEIKIIVTEKNSVDPSVGYQLLGRAVRMPNHKYRENDLLNNGYIYIAGKHSIEKSSELYSNGIISKEEYEINNIIEKEEINIKKMKNPIFKTWINSFEDNFIENELEKYDILVDKMTEILIQLISESKEREVTEKEIKKYVFNENVEHCGLKKLDISSNYAQEEVKKVLMRKFPKILIMDVFTNKNLNINNVNYSLIYESLINLIEKDSNKYLDNLNKRIKYKSINFLFGKRTIIKEKAIKYTRSLYESDDSLNEEEKEFVCFLNNYCEENDKYWIRNKEKIDIRLPFGFYPDFIVFDYNDISIDNFIPKNYFMIEYKGNHLKDNQNSIKKKEYGLSNNDFPILMIIKDSGIFKVRTNDDSYLEFNSKNINFIIKMLDNGK